jgi:hypothetical protein
MVIISLSNRFSCLAVSQLSACMCLISRVLYSVYVWCEFIMALCSSSRALVSCETHAPGDKEK